MRITGVEGGFNNLRKLNEIAEPKKEQDFGEMLSGFVVDVNKDQFKSSQATKDFVDGKEVELHEVMIAGEKAKTSLELLMQIRNKAIDMYKELTRMQ